MPEPVLLAFSGGKDSTMALAMALKDPELTVAALLVTLTEDYRRVSMHGVPESLLDEQGRSIGLPLEKVWIPASAGNETYEQRMQRALEIHKDRGIKRVMFGDLFLEDIREYRERQLKQIGMRAVFPLWGRNTRELARQFVNDGFKGITCCVDNQVLDKSFVGCEMDDAFFRRLPSEVDSCGENGEFHSFVYDGPIFRSPVITRTGETILREERFYYCDLQPEGVDKHATD